MYNLHKEIQKVFDNALKKGFGKEDESNDDVDQGCEFCGGTGVVSVDEDDGEGHVMRGTGSRKCVCRLLPEEENLEHDPTH